MQHIDEQKRKRILETAGRLFRERPFHEVRLEDVAAEAHIGKGTIYIYFRNKADLCRCLILEGMTEVIAEVRRQLQTEGLTPLEKIARLARSALEFAREHGDFRNMELELRQDAEQLRPLMEKREELLGIVAGALREGIAAGTIDDPHPELTARYLLAVLRELVIFPTPDVDSEEIMNHVMRVVGRGVLKRP
jgi:AcrR family transcriptional regulator